MYFFSCLAGARVMWPAVRRSADLRRGAGYEVYGQCLTNRAVAACKGPSPFTPRLCPPGAGFGLRTARQTDELKQLSVWDGKRETGLLLGHYSKPYPSSEKKLSARPFRGASKEKFFFIASTFDYKL